MFENFQQKFKQKIPYINNYKNSCLCVCVSVCPSFSEHTDVHANTRFGKFTCISDVILVQASFWNISLDISFSFLYDLKFFFCIIMSIYVVDDLHSRQLVLKCSHKTFQSLRMNHRFFFFFIIEIFSFLLSDSETMFWHLSLKCKEVPYKIDYCRD